MYDDPNTIFTSSDSEQLREGDSFFLVFPDDSEIAAKLIEIEIDGDSDPETGGAISYISGASFETADGRSGSFGSDGTGSFEGRAFDTQKLPSAVYAAHGKLAAGERLSRYEKGLLIGALDVGERVNVAQAVKIAQILQDRESFSYFDGLAGSGNKLADEVGAWKVRQARNLSVDGGAPFFEALAAEVALDIRKVD